MKSTNKPISRSRLRVKSSSAGHLGVAIVAGGLMQVGGDMFVLGAAILVIWFLYTMGEG